jgi:tetratricopeptide (TPR) repeat protein
MASFALIGLFATQATADEPAARPSATKEVKKDPKGVTGISPYFEALKKGDDAYIARDFDAAIAAYREAITKQAQNPLGHLRMGEAQLAKGDVQEAEKSWAAAMRFAANDPTLKAKALFLLSDLRERQKNYDDARERWSAYAQHAQQQKQAKAYPATAADRNKRIEQWQKLVTEYAAVKERIEKRLAEADKKARESAK